MIEDLKKLAAEHPELRKHLVPLLKQSATNAYIFIGISPTYITIEYEYPVAPMARVEDMMVEQKTCRAALERTLKKMQKEFGGRIDLPDMMYYTSYGKDKRLVLTAPAPLSTALLGVKARELADKYGKKELENMLKNMWNQAGWKVVSVNTESVW